MKDHLHQLVDGAENNQHGICLAREYLQAKILQCLQEQGAFMNWAFLGGTALRFLYSIQRFSEDLDFSTVDSGKDVDFRSTLHHVQTSLKSEGYPISVKVKDAKIVASALVRFPGLLYELELSPHPNQVFSIKVDVDTNPPVGAVTTTTLVRRHVTLNLQHYDKSSLMAGKLHAILSRSWVKGRDLYDLIWYLADSSWPEPNVQLLDAALLQSGWSGSKITETNWRDVIGKKLESLDWDKVRSDVLPFLERSHDIENITGENALSLLRGT